MSKLYWRIFLAFWAVIILTTIVTSAVNSLFFADEVALTRAQSLRASLDALSEQAERALQAGGESALRDWLRRRVENSGTRLLIITPDGRELLGRRIPPGVDGPRASRALPPGPRLRRVLDVATRRLEANDGRVYRLVAPRLPPRARRWLVDQRARRLYPIVLVFVSGLVCFALARYLTRPIAAFRAAGQKITAGDLSARVGPVVGARRDEFGALATDFDRMAERNQLLISAQQRLLRDVSHELRSPLARLQAALGLIRKKGVGELDKNLERIEHEAENLNALIGQVLTMARLDAIERIDTQPTDLDELVASIVADAEFEASLDKRSVHYQGRPGLETEADEQLLRRAIENVVRNALHHARATIRVTLARDAHWARIEVEDDGPGVDVVDLPRLFEPFFTKRGSAAGAGIGLAIARRAVRLHNGAIHAENLAGSGFRVVISLPLTGSA